MKSPLSDMSDSAFERLLSRMLEDLDDNGIDVGRHLPTMTEVKETLEFAGWVIDGDERLNAMLPYVMQQYEGQYEPPEPDYERDYEQPWAERAESWRELK